MVSTELDMAYRGDNGMDEDDDEDDDDYADDFEAFGEEAKSPTEVAKERNLIQVITNRKPKSDDYDDDD